MSTRLSKKRALVAIALSLLVVTGAACGDGDDTETGSGANGSESGSGSGSGGGDGGGDSEMSVEITSPEDGAEVQAPVQLELASSVDIGDTDTGLHHFHVRYDGDAENFDMVFEEGTYTPDRDLGPGEHTVQLVLANADHSETDVTDEVTVTVGDGAGAGTSTSTSADPYSY
jgi:hypothetical protein